MEEFIANILTIFDNINEKKNTNNLLNQVLEEKQYLAYYIYRIWIKYRLLIEYTNSITEFQKVLISLNIPRKYFKYQVTYPMQNKMINNEKQLDLVILLILKQFNECYKYFQTNSSLLSSTQNDNFIIDMQTPQGQYSLLSKLLETKNINTIAKDIKNIKLLVPNLSKPNNEYNLWDNSTPYISNTTTSIPTPSNTISALNTTPTPSNTITSSNTNTTLNTTPTPSNTTNVSNEINANNENNDFNNNENNSYNENNNENNSYNENETPDTTPESTPETTPDNTTPETTPDNTTPDNTTPETTSSNEESVEASNSNEETPNISLFKS